jgi:hypothetical protein
LQQRAELVAAELDSVPGLMLDTQWPRLGAGGEALLDDYFTYHPSVKLAIVDVFAKIRPLRSGRQGSAYTDDYHDVGRLHRVARGHDISLLVIHHTTKQAHEDWVLEASGTMGVSGAADNIIYLQRSRGQPKAELHATGRDVEDDPALPLVWDSERCQWTMSEPLKVPVANPARTRVGEILAAATTSVPLANLISELEQLGLTEGASKMLLTRMVQRGEIVRPEKGLYSLSSALSATRD